MQSAWFTIFLMATLSLPTASGAEKLIVRSVLPSATDSRIDKFSGEGWEHLIYYNPSTRDQKLLFVFIPGTGSKPASARALCTLAGERGFSLRRTRPSRQPEHIAL